MIENRKIILEEKTGEDLRRLTLEQDLKENQSPQWDRMKNNIKEGVAEKATIFGNAFTSSILPAIGICLGFFLLMFIMCGR